MKASNIFSDPQGFIEEQHGVDLDSDGTIGGYQISDMHDEQYGGQLIKHGGEMCGDYYTKKLSPQLEEMEQQVNAKLDQLDQQIATADDPAELQELEQLRDQIAGEWDELMADPHQYIDTGDKIGNFTAFKGRWDDSLKDIQSMLNDANSAIGAGADGIDATHTAPQGEVAGPATIESSGEAGEAGAAAGAESAGSAGSADGATSFEDIDIDDMVNKMSTDPQAVMEELKSLPREDRGMVMQMINQQLQELNQMFSMMSNIQKSMHDTSKAIINNMRV